MNKIVAKIINDNEDNIDNNNFSPVLKEALGQGVVNDILNSFYEADVTPVPTEQLFASLKKHYIDNNSTLTAEQKSEKSKFIQYLINKYQISIFESMLNNQ